MDIFSVFTLCGGLAFFLYGMTTMSKSLEKMAGGKLERTLKRMTSNPLKSLLLGAGITIAIQSSSAMTVMLVGLVNSGVMELGQTIGIIMGSNIGTTLTAWILSLTGIESESVFVNLLKPENFSPLIALAGIILIMGSKKQRRRDIGRIMVGFSILMYGMELMKNAVSPLADLPEFSSLLTAFNNPLLGVLVGAVFTGIIQSSAASVGILQALALTGSITYGMAIPIIMGQNIGTCVTAMISSVGANKNAKRAAVVHLMFNIIGTTVWLAVFYGINHVVQFAFVGQSIDQLGIAIVHTAFNVLCTALLFPFSSLLEKLACHLVPDTKSPETIQILDERLLSTPSVALVRCQEIAETMARISMDALKTGCHLLKQYDPKSAQAVRETEQEADQYEDMLGTYLVKMGRSNLSDKDSRQVSKLLHIIGDFERISDHAVNLVESAEEMRNKGLNFSIYAKRELEILTAAVSEIMDLSLEAFLKDDPSLAVKVEPLEEVVDTLKEQLRNRHILRLQKGECTIELGFVWSDLLTNLERVADHCSNIAGCIIEMSHDSLDVHEYLDNVKAGSPGFLQAYEAYARKYALVE